MNRRDFLASAAATAAAMITGRAAQVMAHDSATASRLDRIGLALFTVPQLLEADFPGTLRQLAGIGYRELQFFGPYPFSVPAAHTRWATVSASLGLKRSGFYGRTPAQVRTIMDDNGLTSPIMHVDLDTLRTRLDAAAEAAHALGQGYLGPSSIPAEARRNLDGYKRVADEFNEIGARMQKLGLRLAYHNHGYGMTKMEGQIPLKVVIERTEPALVALLMDLYWTVAGGGDPIAYLDAYPGRYELMHVKDMSKRVRFTGDGGDYEQWMSLFPYMADAGSGVLDLRTILSHAKRSGVRHFLVEQDLAPNGIDTVRKSYRYLAGLELDDKPKSM
jgi:sugar phosphate isomerase/epimerase